MNPAAFATAESVIAQARSAWRPPPKLTLSEWADQFYYLSAESSAQPGRWVTIPYQKGIMDAFTDPTITEVWVMKSARVGWTKILNAFVGFSIHQDPCPLTVVQPTIEDSKGYSKEEIAPMLRDTPVLSQIVYEDSESDVGPKGSGNTILHKSFPGGVLSFVGANSGTGFRRVSRKRMLLDEVDGFPPSAGSDGDPVKLAIKRTEYYWDRKIGGGSTPKLAGLSRIEKLFHSGDQRRYFVPCPHCNHMAPLVFRESEELAGHWMHWEKDKPETAHFVCAKNGCVIEHEHKRWMVERGEWRARPPCPAGCTTEHVHAQPFDGRASFHIWAAYSYSPNAAWAQLAKEWLEAVKAGAEELQTVVNTLLGEVWKQNGEAPEWERLYQRREEYVIGTVPEGVRFLTCGVDVQKDSWRYEVVGWSGREKESWSIDAGALPGDTGNEEDWAKVDELLSRTYLNAAGVAFTIRMLAVDSGYNTNQVYAWARGHVGRVVAVKGVATQHTLTAPPTSVDVTVRGKRLARGAKVWPVGVDGAKAELYAWLRLAPPLEGDAALPPGWCHFPQYDPEFFRQLTAEHLVSTVSRKGYAVHEWQKIPGRENHQLDCRVYARAAAAVLGIDRIAPTPRAVTPAAPAVPVARPAPAPPRAAAPAPPPINHRALSDSRFLGKRRSGWLKKR